MALTTTYMTNPVKTVIVNQTASTSVGGVGDNNVAGGPTYLISATVDNSQYGTVVYTKFYNLTSATAGTDTATMILYGKASTSHTYTFHPPVYFSKGVSIVTTTTAGQSGTTAPSTPPAVTLVLSESAS
jgi:hypothetical protein